MNRVTLAFVALLALAGGLTLVPRGGRKSFAGARPRVRVGVVFDVGGRGDKSFNDSAYIGAERAERELDAEVVYLEPTGAEDREAALRLFAAREVDLIVGVGFIFSRDVDAVARAYPHRHFACVDYAPSSAGIPANVSALTFREEDGSFLVGAAAGKLTKSRHVGFIGGMTIPLIRKFEAGYREGVHAVCPTCEVHVGYAGSTPEAFKDPEKGKTISLAQIAVGADVLFHAAGSTGHGVFEAAREARILAIGVDGDQYDEMPGIVATSMVKRVDVALFETIRAVLEHRFEPGVHSLGIAEGGVDYVHEGPHAALLPDDVKRTVDDLRAEIARGERKVTLP